MEIFLGNSTDNLFTVKLVEKGKVIKKSENVSFDEAQKALKQYRKIMALSAAEHLEF